MQNFLSDESFNSEPGSSRVRRGTAIERRKFASNRPINLRGPIVEALIMDGHNVNLWRNHDPSTILDVRYLRRLTLAHCNHPIQMPWQSYPPDLQILEMLDPLPSYPIVTNLYLRDQQFARPLSHFRNLKVLDIQNVGAPICEVLWNLCESGKNLKVLKLHDRKISGIDRCYSFQRHQPQFHSTELDCSFDKLLVHLCPNLQTLSLDISSYGLEGDTPMVRRLGSDSISLTLEPLLEELAKYPTFSVSETLRSLTDLRYLRLVTPHSSAQCNGQGALRFADKVWSTKLESFTMVASISGDIYKYSVRPTEYKSVPGSQAEWCVMSRGSSDTTGHEQNSLYLRERFEE